MVRISDLVRTYKLVNDPNSPSWAVKFLGVGLALGLLGAAVTIAFMTRHDEAQTPLASVTGDAQDEEARQPILTDFLPMPVGGPSEVEAAISAWQAAHPDAQILSTMPVFAGDTVTGYAIRYIE